MNFSPFLTLKKLTPEGRFSGYASTYDIDLINDQILPGAFAHTLDFWKKKYQRLPFLHAEHHPEEIIGFCEKLEEDSHGLWIKGKLFLDLPKARESYESLLQKESGLSIGFQIIKSQQKGLIRQISQVALKEVSVVKTPCNQSAKVYACKNYESEDALYRTLRQKIQDIARSIRPT
jgi:uncharacterized protein